MNPVWRVRCEGLHSEPERWFEGRERSEAEDRSPLCQNPVGEGGLGAGDLSGVWRGAPTAATPPPPFWLRH